MRLSDYITERINKTLEWHSKNNVDPEIQAGQLAALSLIQYELDNGTFERTTCRYETESDGCSACHAYWEDGWSVWKYCPYCGNEIVQD